MRNKYVLLQFLYMEIDKIVSSSDNKSVSHWIMFDSFFHI